RSRPRRLLAELVRGADLRCGLVRALLAPGVDLGERLTVLDRVAALLEADDAYGVVDRRVLVGATGTEVQCRRPDGERGELLHVSALRREDLPHERRLRQGALVGVAALRANPPLVGGE